MKASTEDLAHRGSRSRLGVLLRRVILAVGAWLLLSCGVHYGLVPEAPIPPEAQPRVGDSLVNPVVGETVVFTEITGHDDARRFKIRVTLAPGGYVPVAHKHGASRETFEVVEGELTFRHGDETRVLRPGDVVTVEPGEPHAPSNSSGEQAVFTVIIDPGALLGVCLVQLHGFMEETGHGPTSLAGFLQSSRFGLAYDVYLADIPIGLQRAGLTLLDPTLRLLGVDRYLPRHTARARTRGATAPTP